MIDGQGAVVNATMQSPLHPNLSIDAAGRRAGLKVQAGHAERAAGQVPQGHPGGGHALSLPVRPQGGTEPCNFVSSAGCRLTLYHPASLSVASRNPSKRQRIAVVSCRCSWQETRLHLDTCTNQLASRSRTSRPGVCDCGRPTPLPSSVRLLNRWHAESCRGCPPRMSFAFRQLARLPSRALSSPRVAPSRAQLNCSCRCCRLRSDSARSRRSRT